MSVQNQNQTYVAHWHHFQRTELKSAPVWSIFVGFDRFARHFDENCFTTVKGTQE
jgi:hypothetical protein